MDGMMVGLLGDSPSSVVPIVLPQAFFTCPAASAAYDMTYIQGPNGHSHATAPVFRFPAVASGTADTDDLRTRPAIVMPQTSPLKRSWVPTLHLACVLQHVHSSPALGP